MQTLSILEVMSITGIGRTKLYQLINSGSIPAKKLDKRTVILKSDLEEFLSNLEEYPVKKGGKQDD